jgi:hypothetical protein
LGNPIEPVPDVYDESGTIHRHARGHPITGNPFLVGFPANQLLTVVGERVATDNAQIASFQLEHQLGKDARLEVAAMHAMREPVAARLIRQQPPPSIRDPAQVE